MRLGLALLLLFPLDVLAQNRPSGSEPPKPIVTRVKPPSGPPGTEVTIEGLFFLPGATVSIGGVEATVREVTPRRIVAVVGPHKAGRVSVSVTNPNNRGTGVRGWAFTYEPAPAGEAAAKG